MAEMNFSKLHALIVDDFDSFRMTVGKMLQEMGFVHIDSAVNSSEALRLCRTDAYDLILCDHNLGKGKSGQQVLEDLRHFDMPSSDALFVLISAESSKSIIMAAYDYEPDAYLTKPITNKILEQRLERLLLQRAKLAPVSRAIKAKRFDEALALCHREIASGGRYANHCQKLLGQLYLQLGDYPKAEEVYREVLEARPLDWAQLGMARVKKMQGDFIGAQQWLEEALATNPLFMKAYDLQAEIFREQQAKDKLQQTLARAVDISPLSILRQQQLGHVAYENNDLHTAANAYKRTVKLGEYSCFDSLSSHLGFARATLALVREDKAAAQPLLRDLIKVMGAIEQRFGKTPEQKLETDLLEVQLLSALGEHKKAEELLSATQSSAAEAGEQVPLEVQIEMVRALRAAGHKDEAASLLKRLLEENKGHEASLEQLDELLEEPASEKNRARVAAVNKKGIAFYDAGQYVDAIECFNNAAQAFPNHVGIRLNLVQALIEKVKQDRLSRDYEAAQTILTRIENMIDSSHEQFRRYRQLQEMLLASDPEKRR
jgi:CheY-like chemotaxis protein